MKLFNDELIRLQKLSLKKLSQIHKLQDEYDLIMDKIDTELEQLPPELCQIDSQGNFIESDYLDILTSKI